jgi:3-hydroxybutyryl-CoA dehydrogenase
MDREIKRVAVVGAGIMGAGLAQLFAQNGYEVLLHDISDGALRTAIKRSRDNLELQVELGWIATPDVDRALSAISHSTDLGECVREADFVIEAVPEDLELKKDVFARLGELAPGNAVLASNTSTFNVMAEVTGAIAGRVLVTHFFNPAQLVPLVEVVRGENTLDTAVDIAMELLRSVGKVPLLIQRYMPGFVVNRIQLAINGMAYMILLEDVVKPEEIDMAIENSISLRLAAGGPFATMDLGGLDISAASARTMGVEPPAVLAEKVERGELGVKTGKGFYDYAGMDPDEVIRRRDHRLMLLLDAFREGRCPATG